jgi:hypothetical protein
MKWYKIWCTYNDIWNYNWPLFNNDVISDRRGFIIAVNSVKKEVNKVPILGDKWECL